MRLFLALLLWFVSFTAHAIDEPDLLDPEVAFKFSARMVAPDKAEVHYTVAKGYYLYHDKFKFSSPDAQLGKPAIPAGKFIKDEVHPEGAEIYRDQVSITIPVTLPAGASQFTLKATAQGCADAGVCYPPVDSSQVMHIAAAPSGNSNSSSSGKSLSSLLPSLFSGSQDNTFLPPEEAFRLSLKVRDANALLAHFEIADGYYLYRDKIKFSITAGNATLGNISWPTAVTKQDPNFGTMSIYKHAFDVVLPLQRTQAGGSDITVNATYQGCSEKGVCYPPQQKQLKLSLPAGGDSTAPPAPQASPTTSPPAAAAAASGSASQPAANETTQVARLFAAGNWWVIVAFFFGAGLLLALTPCVFPMIPILSGIIAGEGQNISKKKGFILSLAYVQGMAITYALAGIAAGLSGTMLSAALQNPWVLGSFALVFVLLAFSMFGFYELQMPSAIQSRFTETSNRIKGGKLAGVFTMGMLSAVIVGPCVAAPLAGALLYIGQTGNVWLGGSALYSMALGMGVPLLLVGVSAGALLPRAGGWMEAVKSFFGVLLLGVAIWLISPVISTVATMLLWAALLIVSAMYLKAIDPLPVNAKGMQRFWKGIGIIALVIGIALLLGVLSGHRDILQPLQGEAQAANAAGGTEESGKLAFRKITTPAELDQALQDAKGKPVMLDFYADWCVSCKELERFTFSNPQVQAKLAGAVLLQADVTASGSEQRALLKRFGLFGPPGIIFFDPQGQEISSARIVGYLPPEAFLQQIDGKI